MTVCISNAVYLRWDLCDFVDMLYLDRLTVNINQNNLPVMWNSFLSGIFYLVYFQLYPNWQEFLTFAMLMLSIKQFIFKYWQTSILIYRRRILFQQKTVLAIRSVIPIKWLDTWSCVTSIIKIKIKFKIILLIY